MQIETEYHCLCICPKFNDLRKRFFSITWPTVTQFINILASKRRKTQVNTAKCVKEAFEMRDLRLENIV